MDKKSPFSKKSSNFRKSLKTKRSLVPPRFMLLVVALTAIFIIGLTFKSSHFLGDKTFSYMLNKFDSEQESKIAQHTEMALADLDAYPSRLDETIFAGKRAKELDKEKMVEEALAPIEESKQPAQEQGQQQSSANDGLPKALSDLQGSLQNHNFFAEYRIERERNRSQQIELLREIVNNSHSADSTRQEAQETLLSMTDLMRKELEAEKIIIAQGHQDAVVLIQPESVSVVVSKESTDDSKSKIIDIVSSITGRAPSAIAIMTQ
ncbi:SpoIIIAH-like family protein [Heliorestis acidaminivorans]|uniref:SpoIIIAH-like family protein n=1 Tax=Heliorestis acidaminivorans TaxID=553427 RepID=A0A6I0EYF0_9FIRM|nr:SpoIIIAH-like family protein [Heliorestis acidaminivorans]KAB2951675.1 SpoIIIAH-like family protein [Heliorestis acidaminivorans]